MNIFFNLLKDKALKATPQRISILKELEKKMHPTMDDLYVALKKENPSISLATVYKNIAMLKDKGIVIEINGGESKMRYDIYHKPHIHLLCQRCNSLQDIDYTTDLMDFQGKLEESKDIIIERLDLIVTIDGCYKCKGTKK